MGTCQTLVQDNLALDYAERGVCSQGGNKKLIGNKNLLLLFMFISSKVLSTHLGRIPERLLLELKCILNVH